MATTIEPMAPHVDAPPGPQDGRRLYRLSIDQYVAMCDAGILTEDDRVELLEGLLVERMTKNTPHAQGAGFLGGFLYRMARRPEFFVTPEPTIAIPRADRESMPQPDWVVAAGAVGDYEYDRRIGAPDIFVVIEVSDSSLPADRTTQKAIYAWAGIPTYWILNIPERQVEVYTEPTGPAEAPDYGRVEVVREDQEVALVIAGRELGRVAVRDLLPPPKKTA